MVGFFKTRSQRIEQKSDDLRYTFLVLGRKLKEFEQEGFVEEADYLDYLDNMDNVFSEIEANIGYEIDKSFKDQTKELLGYVKEKDFGRPPSEYWDAMRRLSRFFGAYNNVVRPSARIKKAINPTTINVMKYKARGEIEHIRDFWEDPSMLREEMKELLKTGYGKDEDFFEGAWEVMEHYISKPADPLYQHEEFPPYSYPFL